MITVHCKAINEIIYALDDNLGNPDLFTGRKELLKDFEHWVYNIRKRISKSRALLSRRKKGKTVFMKRLYNIVWSQNDKVVPFYYEVEAYNVMLGHFAEDFLSSFLSQYYAFVSRQKHFCRQNIEISGLIELFGDDKDIMSTLINFNRAKVADNPFAMWKIASRAPHYLSSMKNIQVLQFIDEFQNLNKFILDNDKEPLTTLAGSYLGTAESRLAPLLVTGSYIGWLRRIIWELLPARFNEITFGNLETSEGIEMVLKHAKHYEFQVTSEVAEHIVGLTQGDPYYISIIFEGTYTGKKDFTDIENINLIYEYEITKGNIRATWVEYLSKAFSEVNDLNAKRMVLYLFSANGEDRTREQIMNDLKLEMTDGELEKKLKALVYSDIISQGESNFDYKVSTDKIYELVFRDIYRKEIDKIGENVRNALRSQIGKFSYEMGHFYEYMLERIFNKGFKLSDITYNGDDRFIRASGEIYRNYYLKETRLRNIEIDIYGKTETGEELIIESKTWKRKTGIKNVAKYIKLKKKLEEENRNVIFIFFATEGFSKDAEKALNETGIFYGDKVKYPIF